MSDKKNISENMQKAFSEFSSKFSRYLHSEVHNEPDFLKKEDKILHQRLDEKEEEENKEILKKYNLILNDQTPDSDKEQLFAAYNLFKAIKEAEKQFATSDVNLKKDILVTTLEQKTELTTGPDFIYLRCWLMFEKKAEDLVPQFTANSDGTFSLTFVPARFAQYSLADKEIMRVIREKLYKLS